MRLGCICTRDYLLLHGGLALLRLPCFLLGRGRSLNGCRLLLLLLHLKQLLDLHLGEGRRQHRPTWRWRGKGRRQQGRLNGVCFQLDATTGDMYVYMYIYTYTKRL